MMNPELITRLKLKLDALLKDEPFNGKVNHRTRSIFLARWKKILEDEGIRGDGYIDDLLRKLGK